LTGLVYEIVWTRILSTILGSTSLAISVTVSIFMAGLAVGSFFGARLSLRKWSVFGLYGLLEALIGGYALTTPRLAALVERLYAAKYTALAGDFFASVVLKALLASLLLLLPAVAMGATLPILIRLYDPEQRREQAARLYGLNTAGAVVGALLSGYLLIPAFGISRTIYVTACLNGAIALIALLCGRTRSQREDRVDLRIRVFRPLYLLFLLTGFATLCYEILWTRALSMFFGSSVYAFASILAAFLLGLAYGSVYYARRIPAGADSYQLFSLIQFRLALSGVFFVGILMSLPSILILMYRKLYFSFPLFQVGQFALIFCMIAYATFLSGAAFPAALHFFRHEKDRLYVHAGYIYTYNTIGGILGALCAGFVLIPAIGVERSIRIVALINLLLGIFCFRRSSPQSQSRRVLLIGGLALALLMLLPRWNNSIYNAGIYASAYRYVPASDPDRTTFAPDRFSNSFAGLLPEAHAPLSLNLLYYGEGLAATVAVSENSIGIRSLLINGKPDASNMPTGDMRTQLLLGHLPVLLLRGNAHEALVVGLGSGVTAGALGTHHLRRIDCVEIEKKVMEAASFFEIENNSILKRPYFHLIYDDGRNVVQHTSATYDVITSEPSNLWMSGVANLFTREFFQAARGRLRPGGMLCQWIHLYQISSRDVMIFLKTFHFVFPHLSIWIVDSDMLVLGSDQPILIDPGLIQQRLLLPEVARNVEPSGITVGSLLRYYAGDERMVAMMDPSLPLNTDDRPVLEFSAPRSLFFDRSASIRRTLRELQRKAEERTPHR
jgi:spermidine synthase